MDIIDLNLMMGPCWNGARVGEVTRSYNPVEHEDFKFADLVTKLKILVRSMKEMVIQIWLSVLTNNKAFKIDQ